MLSHQYELIKQVDFEFPKEYLTYLFSTESAYEFDGSYLIEINDLLQNNIDYDAAERFAGYFLVGSNGGGEALAIEKATGYFVITPFIGHEEDTPVIIGRTWTEALERIRTGDFFDEQLLSDD